MKVWLIFIQVIFKNISCFIVKLGEGKTRIDFCAGSLLTKENKHFVQKSKFNRGEGKRYKFGKCGIKSRDVDTVRSGFELSAWRGLLCKLQDPSNWILAGRERRTRQRSDPGGESGFSGIDVKYFLHPCSKRPWFSIMIIQWSVVQLIAWKLIIVAKIWKIWYG